MNRWQAFGLFLLLASSTAVALMVLATTLNKSLGQASLPEPTIASTNAFLPPEPKAETPPTRQPTPQLSPQQLQVMDDLYSGRLRGRIIARGTNTERVPVGDTMSLLSYEVEEITLPISVTAEMRVPTANGTYLWPQVITFDKVWIFKVTGGPFRSASWFWTIWLDDQILGDSGGGQDAIATIVFDRSLLREGSRIGVSYGISKPSVHLPERLRIYDAP